VRSLMEEYRISRRLVESSGTYIVAHHHAPTHMHMQGWVVRLGWSAAYIKSPYHSKPSFANHTLKFALFDTFDGSTRSAI
jgi:hypothetical protein